MRRRRWRTPIERVSSFASFLFVRPFVSPTDSAGGRERKRERERERERERGGAEVGKERERPLGSRRLYSLLLFLITFI
jgi:hypothetical protein